MGVYMWPSKESAEDRLYENTVVCHKCKAPALQMDDCRLDLKQAQVLIKGHYCRDCGLKFGGRIFR